MDLRQITASQKSQYNKLVTHVIQSWEWGEFRKSLGGTLLRYGLYENGKLKTAFQINIHKIPFTPFCVGYLPKGSFPNKELSAALTEIGKKHRCIFIKVEPNVEKSDGLPPIHPSFKLSPQTYFTKYNFVLNLTQSQESIRESMHPKTRYNIKIAQKNGVEVKERSDEQALKIYLKLYFETTHRQHFLGHNEVYHRRAWESLKKSRLARILIATYKNTPLTAWMLLNFKDTLYYPYGGSSTEYKNVMANNLVAWEAIKLGKKLGLKKFDMWGALGPNADPKDPWFGFHRFKQGYGGKLVEYIGTYDLVFNHPFYWLFTFIDKLMPLKVFLLKLARI